jgi:hypothetical protein
MSKRKQDQIKLKRSVQSERSEQNETKEIDQVKLKQEIDQLLKSNRLVQFSDTPKIPITNLEVTNAIAQNLQTTNMFITGLAPIPAGAITNLGLNSKQEIVLNPNGPSGFSLQELRIQLASEGVLYGTSQDQYKYTGEGNSLILTGTNNTLGSGNIIVPNSVVCGGNANNVESGHSAVLCGNKNNVQSQFSSILSGETNTIQGSGSKNSILSGTSNTINTNSNNNSITGGQSNNITNASFSSILTGQSNNITNASFSSILTGRSNNITKCDSACIAGIKNTIEDTSSATAIIAGFDNTIKNQCDNASITSGVQNKILNGCISSSIVSGRQNTIQNNCINSSITSGTDITIDGSFSNTTVCKNLKNFGGRIRNAQFLSVLVRNQAIANQAVKPGDFFDYNVKNTDDILVNDNIIPNAVALNFDGNYSSGQEFTFLNDNPEVLFGNFSLVEQKSSNFQMRFFNRNNTNTNVILQRSIFTNDEIIRNLVVPVAPAATPGAPGLDLNCAGLRVQILYINVLNTSGAIIKETWYISGLHIA